MAMNYLWGDMYPSASVLNTAQQTIPEAADKAVLPADNGTDAPAAGIKDAGNSNASTKEIFLFMLALLVVAFLLGCM